MTRKLLDLVLRMSSSGTLSPTPNFRCTFRYDTGAEAMFPMLELSITSWRRLLKIEAVRDTAPLGTTWGSTCGLLYGTVSGFGRH